MVSAIEQVPESNYPSRLFNFRRMQETPGRHMKSLSADHGSSDVYQADDTVTSRSNGYASCNQQNGWSLHRSNNGDKSPKSQLSKEEVKPKQPSDMELMKEKFAKLLLGEDMSGGGKGVSSALALSNAITNLAASVFGEIKRLEPMAPERKASWKREIDWLLSVTDHIVEFAPSQQTTNGVSMEIMTTKQRTDLQMDIPALRKLDAMLIDVLDTFTDQNEFEYVSASDDSGKKRSDDKWWLPTVKVPPEGLSDATRKWLQSHRDSVNQVLKAAMAINAQVLSEMEIPENYLESLPKNGRASLGDSIYKNITAECFDADLFLNNIDLSTDHKVLDLKNRIEASIVIWKRKMNHKDSKSSWGSGFSSEKRELLEERLETILLLIKLRFPGIPQSSLDISKIQYNRDVGKGILESYSRILEGLGYTVLSRIEDVLKADSLAQNPSQGQGKRNQLRRPSLTEEPERLSNYREESAETPTSKTLFDFMGWNMDQGDSEATLKDTKGDELLLKETQEKNKYANMLNTNRKISYLEKL